MDGSVLFLLSPLWTVNSFNNFLDGQAKISRKKAMGKFQSKLASKRRQSPEGGVRSSNFLNSQRELEPIVNNKEKVSWDSCRDYNSPLKVTLLEESGLDHSNHVPGTKLSNNDDSHAAVTARSLARQEWLFTLNNCDDSGTASKEDMSNLLHGVYNAIEASVKPTCESTTALKIKIKVLTSSDGQHSISQTDKEPSACQETGSPVKGLYCAGENIERRNHYLDLAGIENYSSKFDRKESSSHKLHSAPQRHPVVTGENCFYSVKGKPVWKEERSSRLHGQHPTSWCQPTHLKHAAHGHLQRSHSKRLRPGTQDSTLPLRPLCSHVQPGTERDIFTKPQPSSCSPLAVQHEHHHLHEHHHHHHHHHYHAA